MAPTYEAHENYHSLLLGVNVSINFDRTTEVMNYVIETVENYHIKEQEDKLYNSMIKENDLYDYTNQGSTTDLESVINY